jgi:hypothetical protein
MRLRCQAGEDVLLDLEASRKRFDQEWQQAYDSAPKRAQESWGIVGPELANLAECAVRRDNAANRFRKNDVWDEKGMLVVSRVIEQRKHLGELQSLITAHQKCAREISPKLRSELRQAGFDADQVTDILARIVPPAQIANTVQLADVHRQMFAQRIQLCDLFMKRPEAFRSVGDRVLIADDLLLHELKSIERRLAELAKEEQFLIASHKSGGSATLPTTP